MPWVLPVSATAGSQQTLVLPPREKFATLARGIPITSKPQGCVQVTEIQIYSLDLMLHLLSPQMWGADGSSLSSYKPASLHQASEDILAVTGGLSQHEFAEHSFHRPRRAEVLTGSVVKMELTLTLKECVKALTYCSKSTEGKNLACTQQMLTMCLLWARTALSARHTRMSKKARALPSESFQSDERTWWASEKRKT